MTKLQFLMLLSDETPFSDCSHPPYPDGGVYIKYLWLHNKPIQNLVAHDGSSGDSLAAPGQFLWLSLTFFLQLDSRWD